MVILTFSIEYYHLFVSKEKLFTLITIFLYNNLPDIGALRTLYKIFVNVPVSGIKSFACECE